MKSAIASGALCLAIGLGLGATYTGLSAAARPVVAAPAPTLVAERPTDVLTRADLDAALRSERVRAAEADSDPAGVRTATAAAEAPVTRDQLPPELAERADLATRTVDTAISRGVWRDADREQLIDQFDGLPGPVKAEIFARFSDAVNRGLVQVETDGLPL